MGSVAPQEVFVSLVDRIVFRLIHRRGATAHVHGAHEHAPEHAGRQTPGRDGSDDLTAPGRFAGEHADRYATSSRSRGRRRFYRRIARDVARLTPDGGHVLDVGTGPGMLLLEIARSRPDLRATGVDLEPAMVEIAARLADDEGLAARVTFHAADVTALPLDAGSVDVAVATLTAHHWADVPGAVRELVRVLRPGGTLLVVDFRSAVHEPLTAALAAEAPGASPRRTTRWAWSLPALAAWEIHLPGA